MHVERCDVQPEKKLISHTNIEWVRNPDGSQGFVWNPVYGCRHLCCYCYARSMARRFAYQIANAEVDWCGVSKGRQALKKDLAEQIGNFNVTWLESHFCKRFPRGPARIFVNSMSDIAFWKKEWMHRVISRIYAHPEHTFILLTKSPAVYSRYIFPDNCWLGATATTWREVHERQEYLLCFGRNLTFLSIEPIQERIPAWIIKWGINWVIVGMETGNRKDRVIPHAEWIREMSYLAGCPVFMKDNLKKIIGDNGLVREFPRVPK